MTVEHVAAEVPSMVETFHQELYSELIRSLLFNYDSYLPAILPHLWSESAEGVYAIIC